MEHTEKPCTWRDTSNQDKYPLLTINALQNFQGYINMIYKIIKKTTESIFPYKICKNYLIQNT